MKFFKKVSLFLTGVMTFSVLGCGSASAQDSTNVNTVDAGSYYATGQEVDDILEMTEKFKPYLEMNELGQYELNMEKLQYSGIPQDQIEEFAAGLEFGYKNPLEESIVEEPSLNNQDGINSRVSVWADSLYFYISFSKLEAAMFSWVARSAAALSAVGVAYFGIKVSSTSNVRIKNRNIVYRDFLAMLGAVCYATSVLVEPFTKNGCTIKIPLFFAELVDSSGTVILDGINNSGSYSRVVKTVYM